MVIADLPTRPTTIIIDFEKAVENSFRQQIPGASIHGCFFHFAQAVWRKAQQIGMERRYVADEQYRCLIKMFTALTFCRPADVIGRFNELAEYFIGTAGNEDAHIQFLNYFESTWVGRAGRPPLFPREMWNNNFITLLDLPRTTNSVESWHHQIQSKFSSPHPNLYKFIEGLREENVRINAICVKLDGGQEVPLYSRREYQESNQRLLNILQRYGQIDTESFLRATSRFIKYRGVDPVQEEQEDDDE
uniref:MULE transposase domain-containing protein n=1 Tax=Meloidogyne javanica TaxID=6303 RepID=A0A915LGH1_MELJA